MSMVYPVARLGDSSSHGGTIISSCSKTYSENALIARVENLHSCPIPGHGVTPIETGSPNFQVEGQNCARGNGGSGSSITGCGALIIGGCSHTSCA